MSQPHFESQHYRIPLPNYGVAPVGLSAAIHWLPQMVLWVAPAGPE